MKRFEIINKTKFREEVSELPELYRDALLLYYLSDLNKKAVAEKMNLSYGVFRNRLSKGVYLWKKIAEKGDEVLAP